MLPQIVGHQFVEASVKLLMSLLMLGDRLDHIFFFAHRALAALLAISLRRAAGISFFRVLPAARPPARPAVASASRPRSLAERLPIATAAGFFFVGILGYCSSAATAYTKL